MNYEALNDPEYMDFIKSNKQRRFRWAGSNAYRLAMPSAQVAGLILGLDERTKQHGVDFTLLDVVHWFDMLHNDEWIMTKMGAARIFVYYLPQLKRAGVVEEL